MTELNIWWSNNVKRGYWLLDRQYTVFFEKRDKNKNWNYTIAIGDEVVYHIPNAKYAKRKDAVASAKDWLSLRSN